eukprot:TCONS_00024047-protein
MNPITALANILLVILIASTSSFASPPTPQTPYRQRIEQIASASGDGSPGSQSPDWYPQNYTVNRYKNGDLVSGNFSNGCHGIFAYDNDTNCICKNETTFYWRDGANWWTEMSCWLTTPTDFQVRLKGSIRGVGFIKQMGAAWQIDGNSMIEAKRLSGLNLSNCQTLTVETDSLVYMGYNGWNNYYNSSSMFEVTQHGTGHFKLKINSKDHTLAGHLVQLSFTCFKNFSSGELFSTVLKFEGQMSYRNLSSTPPPTMPPTQPTPIGKSTPRDAESEGVEDTNEALVIGIVVAVVVIFVLLVLLVVLWRRRGKQNSPTNTKQNETEFYQAPSYNYPDNKPNPFSGSTKALFNQTNHPGNLHINNNGGNSPAPPVPRSPRPNSRPVSAAYNNGYIDMANDNPQQYTALNSNTRVDQQYQPINSPKDKIPTLSEQDEYLDLTDPKNNKQQTTPGEIYTDLDYQPGNIYEGVAQPGHKNNPRNYNGSNNPSKTSETYADLQGAQRTPETYQDLNTARPPVNETYEDIKNGTDYDNPTESK